MTRAEYFKSLDMICENDSLKSNSKMPLKSVPCYFKKDSLLYP